jgi:hypothetical protein
VGPLTRWFESTRHPDYPVFTPAGEVFAQVSLVGIWGAFGGSSWVMLVIGVTVGASHKEPDWLTGRAALLDQINTPGGCRYALAQGEPMI